MNYHEKFIIGAIYGPPDDEKFFVNFSTILTSIRHKRKNILLGDFNADLFDQGGGEAIPGNKMKRLIKCFELKNIIKEPTRISRTAKTLIDLIIVSDTDKVERSGSLEPAISDHMLIFCVLKIKNVSLKTVVKQIRTKRAFDEEQFRNQLNEAPWWVMEVFDDIDDMVFTWEIMHKNILSEFINTRKAKVKIIPYLG